MSFLEKYFNKVPAGNRCKSAIAYMASLDCIESEYPLIAQAIIQELKDQRTHLKLIASENFSSLAVQLSMGNLLTDKYSEGSPYHRFYAGCDNIDKIEAAAVTEANKLFNSEHAYVQPHSGADANLVAYWAILIHRIQNKEISQLGKKTANDLTPEEYERIRQLLVNQKVMGMSLNSGGHLTHGFRQNISAKMMQATQYDVDPKTGLIDYQALSEQAKREKPLILVAGYSAYPRWINFAKMREIADSVGATLFVDMAHFAGLVAGKVMTGEFNPIPFAHIITSTTHKTLRGPRGGLILCTQEFKEVVDKGCPMVLGGPLPHIMAAKALALKEANSSDFQKYAHQIVKNAQALAEAFIHQGVELTTGGTDNHLLVMNVAKSFGLTGLQAEGVLREAGCTVNRNAIPFDTNGAWFTSGIRIGTPAITTLGMREEEMKEIAKWMTLLLKESSPTTLQPGSFSRTKASANPKTLAIVREELSHLLTKFPLYPELVID